MKKELHTQERIFETAHDLFMRFGLKSVSMDDIAGKLAVSKKTIYQHYADKEALVLDVVKRITSDNQMKCEEDIQTSVNAVHEIMLAMKQMSVLFHTMNPSILYDLRKYYPKAYRIFLQHKNEFIYNKIRLNILRGVREGLYRDNVNIEILTRFRVESILMPFNPDFQQALEGDLAAVSGEISMHYLHGIATTKGQKIIQQYIHLHTKNKK